MNRDEAIREIRAALKRRSGKSWSVTGGRGTAWGWIDINIPPKDRVWHSREVGTDINGNPVYEWYIDRTEPGSMGPGDRKWLTDLLGLSSKVSHQGQSIPASSLHYQEYVDRANGRTPTVTGYQYWD